MINEPNHKPVYFNFKLKFLLNRSKECMIQDRAFNNRRKNKNNKSTDTCLTLRMNLLKDRSNHIHF